MKLPVLAACTVAYAIALHAADRSWMDDLTPITTSDWNYDRAAHLLERAGFGGTPEEIERLVAMSPREAVRHLVYYQKVQNVPMPDFDASGIFPSKDFDPLPGNTLGIAAAMRTGEALGIKVERKPGTMWLQPVVDYGYYLRFSNNGEIGRVARWLAQRMLITERPLEEKLALFWHGHFATENDKVRDYRKLMAQWDLYRAQGNGSFRNLLLSISMDPAMLIYLDGIKNVKGHANENYAREILEIFSLGDGNYTEADIKATARAFTGWGLDGNKFVKRADLHDDGEKTFRGVTGNFDGEDMVNLIVKQPACAKFISRKLYRFFVREDLSAGLQEKLSAVLRRNDFEVAALLETVFLSRDFYSDSSDATQVKSPVQLVVSTYRKLGLKEIPGAPNFNQMTAGLGQTLCAPPNVAGWKGGRTWINPATIIERENFVRYVLFPKEIPPPRRKPLDFVADIIGDRAYQQMNEMARRGDFSSAPEMAMEDSGFNRTGGLRSESYNIFRGVYNGGIKALKTLKFDPPMPATVDVAGMIRQAGVIDAQGAVDYLGRRFLRVKMQEADRQSLMEFLAKRLGSSSIDFSKGNLETDLRELLHLVLSMPEYQLA
jgi:hypothetical protein